MRKRLGIARSDELDGEFRISPRMRIREKERATMTILCFNAGLISFETARSA